MARSPRTNHRPALRRRFTVKPGQAFRLALFVGLGGILAWQAALQPAVNVLAKRNPILAARVTGSPDARIALWMAEALSKPEKLKEPAIVPLLQQALARSPLDAAALRTLAFHSDATGKQQRAERLVLLSQQVSRRDVLAQLLLAQIAARGGRTQQAVGHLSNALKTSGDARDAIYAVMAPMLTQPQLRSELPRVLGQDGGWIVEFLDYALRRQPDGATYTAEILANADLADARPGYDRLGANLLSALAEQGKFDLVRQTYARMRGNGPDLTRVAALERRTIDPKLGWLAWSGIQSGSNGSEVEATGQDGATAAVYAGTGARGVVALRRVTMLPPGSYRLFEQREVSFGPSAARAVWKIRCLSGPNSEVIWSGPDSALAYDASGQPTISIPARCEAQMFELEVSSPQGSGGFELLIRKFDLVPVS